MRTSHARTETRLNADSTCGPTSCTYSFETARACRELVGIQTEMLTCIDPQMRGQQLDVAVAQADASVALINELEQQLKAAKTLA